MTKKRNFLFEALRIIFLCAYFAIPNKVLSWIRVFGQIVRNALWSVRLKQFGEDAHIFSNVVIHGANCVTLGDRASIGEFSHLWGNAGITIGNNTLIAAGCYITTLSHDTTAMIYKDSLKSAPIAIGDNVWLGYGVRIMPGVSIGDNSIVAAGSIVTKNIPPNVLASGAPAHVRRELKQHEIKELV
jgi:acetyltransferase-like isoleucine patch superfamily enzyme